jgi:hypothetical protein
MRKRTLVSLVAMLLVLAVCASAMAATRWIKTGNGKPANGREQPTSNSTLIATIPYGTQVNTVGKSVNGYTPVEKAGGSDTVYVLTKFLVKSKPGKYVPNNNTSGGSGSTSSGIQSAIVNEFNAAKYVSPYDVVTYHKRASGLINMRWAPSEKAKLIHAYPAGETLTVLAELKNWYQVQDPETGWVGFVRKDFLEK